MTRELDITKRDVIFHHDCHACEKQRFMTSGFRARIFASANPGHTPAGKRFIGGRLSRYAQYAPHSAYALHAYGLLPVAMCSPAGLRAYAPGTAAANYKIGANPHESEI